MQMSLGEGNSSSEDTMIPQSCWRRALVVAANGRIALLLSAVRWDAWQNAPMNVVCYLIKSHQRTQNETGNSYEDAFSFWKSFIPTLSFHRLDSLSGLNIISIDFVVKDVHRMFRTKVTRLVMCMTGRTTSGQRFSQIQNSDGFTSMPAKPLWIRR